MCEVSMRKEGLIMKKRLTIITAALILVLSAAGCGQKDTDTSNTSQEVQDTQQVDVSEAYSERVDMDKVDGEQASSESDEEEYKGELGDVEVTIGDAKVIQYEDDDVAVVSFEYTNKGNEDMSFTGALVVSAYQNGSKIPEATVVDVEGVEMLSMVENVPKGDTITVQKAYKLRDSSSMTVEVLAFDQTKSDAVLTKTFDF